MKIRFQADADLRVPIITGIRRREPSVDFATAIEATLTGLSDLAVLAIAASRGRVLVTHDVSTMPEAFSAFIQKQSSPGVILISQELSYREAIEGLLQVWTNSEAEEWRMLCRSYRDEALTCYGSDHFIVLNSSLISFMYCSTFFFRSSGSVSCVS